MPSAAYHCKARPNTTACCDMRENMGEREHILKGTFLCNLALFSSLNAHRMIYSVPLDIENQTNVFVNSSNCACASTSLVLPKPTSERQIAHQKMLTFPSSFCGDFYPKSFPRVPVLEDRQPHVPKFLPCSHSCDQLIVSRFAAIRAERDQGGIGDTNKNC